VELAKTIIVSLLTSTAVAGFLVFMVKQYVEKRIKLRFDKELERVKTELSMAAARDQEMLRREFDIYPSLSEQVYRARNCARDVYEHFGNWYQSLEEAYVGSVQTLTEQLFRYRLFLEEETFARVHKYKTDLSAFYAVFAEAKRKLDGGDAEGAEKLMRNHLRQLWTAVDRQHAEIIELLRNKVKAPRKVNADSRTSASS